MIISYKMFSGNICIGSFPSPLKVEPNLKYKNKIGWAQHTISIQGVNYCFE